MEKFEIGEYIIYVNGDKYELGRITSLRPDGAFVCYHEGETAAKTPYHTMHKLANRYTISRTTLGGGRFEEISPTADAEPVRYGRWIEDTDEKRPALFQRGWICTACGSRQTYGRSDYCPRCGAIMDEEEE